MAEPTSKLLLEQALLPGGWAEDVLVTIRGGYVLSAEPGGTDKEAEPVRGPVLPGLPNLHSHAFQRGMAGLAERREAGRDSFWTWRETMYGFLERLTPDDVQAIAAQAYVEMLEAGFTAVGEFHYLHHDRDGRPYQNPAEMGGRIAVAAAATGIGLTLLPVFYANGGFGGEPAGSGQKRFVTDLDGFARLVEASRAALLSLPDAALGIAPHSLRAVTPQTLSKLLATRPAGPVHIHAAEQVREVEDCLAWSGMRPIEWLLEHAGPDAAWCVIHATHMTPGECAALAASGAVAGLCPITEANLGDGIFEAVAYAGSGGRFGIGTDSNVRISAAEELRMLEYSQRLRQRERNCLAVRPGSTGRQLYMAALAGGAQALGRDIGSIEPGKRADFVVLDPEHPVLFAARGDGLLDGWFFAGGNGCVREVWTGGRRVVAEGRHVAREAVAARYRRTMRRLTG